MITKPIKTGEFQRLITVTAVRMANDINGNPRYKVHVWTSSFGGNLWTPVVKGFRRTKDDGYVLKSVYDVEEDVDKFIETFQDSVNEVTV